MMDVSGWILVAAIAATLIAAGGLISSILNRRYLRELGIKVDHTNKNAKMVKVALDARYAKEAERLAAGPTNVIVINPDDNPVPVENVGEK